jgi:hypothetical protein
MLHKLFFLIIIFIAASSISGQYKIKMLVDLPPAYGQYKLKIIPVLYDSTVTDSAIIRCIDTLPSYFLGVRTYNLLYKDDTTRLAIMINEHGLFRKKASITQYWKNGNIKRFTAYKRHSKHYWSYNYYTNATLSSQGKYRNNKKIGRWVYINTVKKKIRVEHYTLPGMLKKTRVFDPPRGTIATLFMAPQPQGNPYSIKE